MSFCPNCGNQLEDGVKFCSKCGTPVAVQAAPVPVHPAELEPTVAVYIPEDSRVHPAQQVVQPSEYYAAAQAQYSPQLYNAQQPVYQTSGNSNVPSPVHKQPIESGPDRKTKKKKSVIPLIVVIALLLAALAAGAFFLFGMDGVNEIYFGTYECVSASKSGKAVDLDDLFEDGASLELMSGGKGVFTRDDESVNIKWKLNDESITLIIEGDEFEGSFKYGAVSVKMKGYTYRFVNEQLAKTYYEADAGYYKLISYKVNGRKEDREDYLILKADGTAVIVYGPAEDGELFIGTAHSWEPGVITIDDVECEYAIEDKELTIEAEKDGDKFAMVFERTTKSKLPDYEMIDDTDSAEDGSTETADDSSGEIADDVSVPAVSDDQPVELPAQIEELETPEPEISAEPEVPAEQNPAVTTDPEITGDPDLDYWYGDWYGWWSAYNVVGEDFDYLVDSSWDCYATIDVSSDGILTFNIWDDDWDIGVVYMEHMVEQSDEYGELTGGISYDGNFLDYSVEDTMGCVRMDKFMGLGEKLIYVTGRYVSADGTQSFDFHMYLRPWGVYWDDLGTENFPPYYTDWYLKMLEKGYLMPGGLYGGTDDWEIDGFSPD